MLGFLADIRANFTTPFLKPRTMSWEDKSPRHIFRARERKEGQRRGIKIGVGELGES